VTARQVKLVATLATIVAIAWLALRSVTTAAGFPLLGVDARVFLPQALAYAQSGELVNHVWQPAASLDPTGARRMVYHGFLYPMVIASLIGKPSGENLAILLAAIQTLAALALPLLLLDLRRRLGLAMTAGAWLWTLAFGLAGAVYSYGSPGRPEPLVTLLIMLAVMAGWRLPLGWRVRGAGLLLGLVAALDPLVGLLGALATLAVCAWTLRPREFLAAALIAGGYAMACFAFLITLVYPYPWQDWVLGTLRMGKVALSDGRTSEALVHWMTNGPNWMLPVALIAIATGAAWLARGHAPKSPLAFAAAMLLALGAIVRFTVMQHWATYNLVPFLPIGMIAPYLAVTASRSPLALRLALAACLLVIAAGLVRDLAMRAMWIHDGITLRQATRHLAEFRAKHPEARILIAETLFSVAPDPAGRGGFFRGVPPRSAAFVVVPQAFGKHLTPPTLPGFSLLEDHFQKSTPTVLGLALAADQKGCGFAIYRRDMPPEADAPP